MRKRVYTLSEVKSRVTKLKGQEVILKVSRGRNRFESRSGVISNIYPALFTVLEAGDEMTYSYSAVACGDVELM